MQNYALLKELPAVLSSDDEAAFEGLLKEMRGGKTSKLTRRNRLAALDEVLIGELGERFDGSVTIHDMAASSAITSVELYHRLHVLRPVDLLASDFYDAVYFVGSWILNADGKPLRRTPLSRLGRIAHGLGLSRRVSLFHPAALALARDDTNFRLAREDLFGPSAAQYHVVRIMNALTMKNFPRQDIERAVRAIVPTVRDKGLLVLGQCDEADEQIDATIFVKEGARFSIARQIGAGCHHALVN
jgi:hypothetical protein